ncbi:L-type lectin-domain containing receptor kinase IX.1-like protein [Tanacetum coccineum]
MEQIGAKRIGTSQSITANCHLTSYSGNQRKYIAKRCIRIFIWCAYLMADWIAIVALGLLVDRQGNFSSSDNTKNKYEVLMLIAFWAPYLLLHLGGPDAITTFALADNELWRDCAFLWTRKKKTREVEAEETGFDIEMDNEFEMGTRPKRFTYHELARATGDFAENDKLREGGYGGVYRGFLKDSKTFVAVKRKSGAIRTPACLRIYGNWKLRSLDSQKSGAIRPWITDCDHFTSFQGQELVDMGHKLGDFGLAKLVVHKKGLQTTMLAGNLGYMAPECVVTGKIAA